MRMSVETSPGTGPIRVACRRPRSSARLNVGSRAPDGGAPAPRRPEARIRSIRLGGPLSGCAPRTVGPQPHDVRRRAIPGVLGLLASRPGQADGSLLLVDG